jgi:hypothetical protein
MAKMGPTLVSDPCGGDLLPLSPFDSLKYHFGMLLGVDDFETEQAYHRGKMRLHNAWLHRQGVVWGFGVNVDNEHGEIRVKPGLALDAAGHELHLDSEYCINVGEWFDKHEKDPGFDLVRDGFDVHVVICFKACLNHQVPALLEPCDTGSTGTAYSRVHETLEIRLLPKRAPTPVDPYHRLRLLFSIAEAKPLDQAAFDQLVSLETAENLSPEQRQTLNAARADRHVLDKLDEIDALPADQRASARLKAFHELAALDEIDLQPGTSEDGARLLMFPGAEDECLVLADITELKLEKQDDKSVLTGGKVDVSVRPSHVATTTIQDLLCGRMGATSGGPAADTGPRIDPNSVVFLTARAISLTADKQLQTESVKRAAFSVTFFDPVQGWRTANVANAAYGGDETKTITLDLDSDLSGRVRMIVSGSGPTPILGKDLVPLAGAVGGPPASPHDGQDFVVMKDFVVSPEEPDDGGNGESARTESTAAVEPATTRRRPRK